MSETQANPGSEEDFVGIRTEIGGVIPNLISAAYQVDHSVHQWRESLQLVLHERSFSVQFWLGKGKCNKQNTTIPLPFRKSYSSKLN